MEKMLERIVDLIGHKHGAKKRLADHLNISQNVFTSWFSGKSESYTKYAAEIADYFGVTMDYLSGKTDEKKKPVTGSGDELSDMDKDVIDLLRRLTPEELSQMSAFGQGLIAARKK